MMIALPRDTAPPSPSPSADPHVPVTHAVYWTLLLDAHTLPPIARTATSRGDIASYGAHFCSRARAPPTLLEPQVSTLYARSLRCGPRGGLRGAFQSANQLAARATATRASMGGCHYEVSAVLGAYRRGSKDGFVVVAPRRCTGLRWARGVHVLACAKMQFSPKVDNSRLARHHARWLVSKDFCRVRTSDCVAQPLGGSGSSIFPIYDKVSGCVQKIKSLLVPDSITS
ncbi:hypothetical protein BC628DRAFT_238123 [Trametes gibbosa]|nr:hypothetical protein BC628DRAFT_238123 [Trametes gibbosa]